MLTAVQNLLKENESILLRERRSTQRHAFVRPVDVLLSNNEVIGCFTKDISPGGVGIIAPRSFEVRTIAKLKIHSLRRKSDVIAAELRWCEPYGKGWFVTGWHFIDR